MSYWIEDENGFVGDLASNQGMRELEVLAPAPLKSFLNAGEADQRLVDKIIETCKGKEGLNYISEMLDGVEPPIIVTDGVEDAD